MTKPRARDRIHHVGALEPLRQRDRRDRRRARAFGSEDRDLEIHARHGALEPRRGRVAHRSVALPAALDSLAQDVGELRVERVEERERGRGRRLVLRRELLELDDVEVEAAVGDAAGAPEELGRRDAEREARRERERLLRAGEDEVESPLVEAELGAGDAGDAVDEAQRVMPVRELASRRGRR